MLEGMAVVEILCPGPRRRGRLVISILGGRGGATAPLAAALAAHSTGASGSPAQHLHVIGDDFGGVTIVSLLVLPLAGPQFALHEHLRALAQVLGSDFTQPPEKGDAVPFGALLLRTRGLVLPLLLVADPD